MDENSMVTSLREDNDPKNKSANLDKDKDKDKDLQSVSGSVTKNEGALILVILAKIRSKLVIWMELLSMNSWLHRIITLLK